VLIVAGAAFGRDFPDSGCAASLLDERVMPTGFYPPTPVSCPDPLG
jgi:hypothetical protein